MDKVPHPTVLPPGLQQRLGASHMQKREQAELNQLHECPPLSRQLIEHLRLKFSDPGSSAKPTNPLLGQLLIVQYGCDKVIDYLEKHLDMQSAKARKDYEA